MFQGVPGVPFRPPVLCRRAQTVAVQILTVHDGYRFANREGESILSAIEKCPETVRFCDSSCIATARHSPSIHRDA
jgi:hypothetical protein